MASPLEDSTLEEQRSVNRFLVAEGVKPSEIFRERQERWDKCLTVGGNYVEK